MCTRKRLDACTYFARLTRRFASSVHQDTPVNRYRQRAYVDCMMRIMLGVETGCVGRVVHNLQCPKPRPQRRGPENSERQQLNASGVFIITRHFNLCFTLVSLKTSTKSTATYKKSCVEGCRLRLLAVRWLSRSEFTYFYIKVKHSNSHLNNSVVWMRLGLLAVASTPAQKVSNFV